MLKFIIIFIHLFYVCKGFDFFKPEEYGTKNVTITPMYNVSKVHVIFMNHLDVGYNGIPVTGFINNVLNTYFQTYFKTAIQVINGLKAGGFRETFIYTTHPWLVDLYLNCPPNLVLSGVKLQCPTSVDLKAFVLAIQSGNITWHAGPMNFNYDLYNDFLVDVAFNISARLDAMFNITRGVKVLSQRDVPGLTKALIPGMVRNNVFGISSGVNSGSANADVPFLFRWQYYSQEVIYMINKGGYPNPPGPTPSNPGGSGIEQCRWIDGVPEVMCWAFKTDNSGPPATVQEVLNDYEIFRAQFPAAQIFASTLDKFFSILWQNKDKLPIVYSEIGDTWVQGVASDPWKLAEFKTISRALSECYNSEGCYDPSDERLINATRFLIKSPEHTFGLPSSYDNVHYANYDLPVFLNSSGAKNNVLAWLEQRYFNNLTMDALQDHPVKTVIEDEIQQLVASYPDLSKYTVVDNPFDPQTCLPSNTTISFATDGSISYLYYGGWNLASNSSRLGQILYRTYNESDTAFFIKYYSNGWNTGFGRDNSTENAHPESRWWPVSLTQLYRSNTEHCQFTALITHSGPTPYLYYGAPKEYWITYNFGNSGVSFVLDIELQMLEKTVTRLMEAIYLNFQFPPPVSSSRGVYLNKIDKNLVWPFDVVQNGSQWQHGISDGGVTLSSQTQEYYWNIQAFDTPLTCPVTNSYGPTVWPAPLARIDEDITAIAFNIYNNVWSTNYIFWYPYVNQDSNLKARYRLTWTRD